jgi:hypothetical protein
VEERGTFEPIEKEKNLLPVIKWNFGLTAFNPAAYPLHRVGYFGCFLKKIMSVLNTISSDVASCLEYTG